MINQMGVICMHMRSFVLLRIACRWNGVKGRANPFVGPVCLGGFQTASPFFCQRVGRRAGLLWCGLTPQPVLLVRHFEFEVALGCKRGDALPFCARQQWHTGIRFDCERQDAQCMIMLAEDY